MDATEPLVVSRVPQMNAASDQTLQSVPVVGMEAPVTHLSGPASLAHPSTPVSAPRPAPPTLNDDTPATEPADVADSLETLSLESTVDLPVAANDDAPKESDEPAPTESSSEKAPVSLTALPPHQLGPLTSLSRSSRMAMPRRPSACLPGTATLPIPMPRRKGPTSRRRSLSCRPRNLSRTSCKT